MMWRRAVALMAAFAALVGLPVVATAQEPGDSATVTVSSLAIGERTPMVIEVVAPAGATVDIDPSSPGWNGVEVIRVVPAGVTPAGEGQSRYRFELVVAAFQPGALSFEPSVAIITDEGASIRALPAVMLEVRSSLPADAPLEISPLPPPGSIAGAESPLLRPAIGLGVVAALALVALALFFALRAAARRMRPAEDAPAPDEAQPAGFEVIESMIDADPVGAYRSLAAIVRGVIGQRFELPATALTTTELRARMEASGADRFMARLVGGFLEECDSVVYAGYRPAAERRRADLTMAREIVEGAP